MFAPKTATESTLDRIIRASIDINKEVDEDVEAGIVITMNNGCRYEGNVAACDDAMIILVSIKTSEDDGSPITKAIFLNRDHISSVELEKNLMERVYELSEIERTVS